MSFQSAKSMLLTIILRSIFRWSFLGLQKNQKCFQIIFPKFFFVFYLSLSFLLMMIFLALKEKMMPKLQMRLRTVRPERIPNQNQRKTYIFSLMMLMGRMHWASCLCSVPDGPYFRKVHFVTRGNTRDIGSMRLAG